MLDIVKSKWVCKYPLPRYRFRRATGPPYGILRGNLLKSESGKIRETGFCEGVYDDE